MGNQAVNVMSEAGRAVTDFVASFGKKVELEPKPESKPPVDSKKVVESKKPDAESKKVDSTPADSEPVESKQPKPKPDETKPAESKPAESKQPEAESKPEQFPEEPPTKMEQEKCVSIKTEPQPAAPQDKTTTEPKKKKPEKVHILKKGRSTPSPAPSMANSVAQSVNEAVMGNQAVNVMSEAGRAVTHFVTSFGKNVEPEPKPESKAPVESKKVVESKKPEAESEKVESKPADSKQPEAKPAESKPDQSKQPEAESKPEQSPEEPSTKMEQEGHLTIKTEPQPEQQQPEIELSNEDETPQIHEHVQVDAELPSPPSTHRRVHSSAGNIEIFANFDDTSGGYRIKSAKPCSAISRDDEDDFDYEDLALGARQNSFPMIKLTETAMTGRSVKNITNELKSLEEEKKDEDIVVPLTKIDAVKVPVKPSVVKQTEVKSEPASITTSITSRSRLRGRGKGIKSLSVKKLRFVSMMSSKANKAQKDDTSSVAKSAANSITSRSASSDKQQEKKKKLNLKATLAKVKSSKESPANKEDATVAGGVSAAAVVATTPPAVATTPPAVAKTETPPPVPPVKTEYDLELNQNNGHDEQQQDRKTTSPMKQGFRTAASHARCDASTRAVAASVVESEDVAGKAISAAMDKKAAGKAKLEHAMKELKEKQAAAAAKRDAAIEKASHKKELEKELKEDLRSMKIDKKKQKQHLTSAKKERNIQEQELDAARKKAKIAKAKLEQAKAEQDAAHVEAEAIAAREEAKRVLEELKEVKTEVLQMTATNKKNQEKLLLLNNQNNGLDNEDISTPMLGEFNLKLREDDQTMISELTPHFDDHTLETHVDNGHGDNQKGLDGCGGFDSAQFDDMVQGFLHWFMGDDDEESTLDETYDDKKNKKRLGSSRR